MSEARGVMARALRLRELFPGDALGGIVLLLSALGAIAWANSPFAASYFDALHRPLPLRAGPLAIELTLHGWINDLLMAVFFLVVGLEIKRELLVGELADWRRAALPIAGALGGMVFPATIYAALNAGGPGARGWGIPMATDIAFSLGVLALLGTRVPRGVTLFLVALAIVDDLGAVAVIALFYAGEIDLTALAVAFAIAGALAWLGARGERRLWPFLLAAPVLWWFMLRSGVHATVAGVLLGFAVPLGRPGEAAGDPRTGASPLERLEHALRPWVTWGVLPVFALANAGVSFRGLSLASLAEPVALGTALGLLVGKPIGITLFSWLAVRARIASPPREAGFGHLWGVAMVAGVGFTVALFVASLSFQPGDGLEDRAKIGILVGSALSAVLGLVFLRSLPPVSATASRPADSAPSSPAPPGGPS